VRPDENGYIDIPRGVEQVIDAMPLPNQ